MTTVYVHALLEGAADVPVISELLQRRFGMTPEVDFLLHPHRGKGRLPDNIHGEPDKHNRTLLHQLPARLRAYRDLGEEVLVLVVVDADDAPAQDLLNELEAMLQALDHRPARVLFRLAIEETESWFLADPAAIKAAYPTANLRLIQKIEPDSIVGAWERLAECLGRRGQAAPKDKYVWAERIAPHLNFEDIRSPSLRSLVRGLRAEGLGESD